MPKTDDITDDIILTANRLDDGVVPWMTQLPRSRMV